MKASRVKKFYLRSFDSHIFNLAICLIGTLCSYRFAIVSNLADLWDHARNNNR